MDICSFCLQPGNLFTTGDSSTFACAKCQPYVQDTNSAPDHDAPELNSSTDDLPNANHGKLFITQMSGEDGALHCRLCNKTFDRNLKFQNHMRNHRAERKYVCPHCCKGFSQSNNLRAHLRIHTNERPYKCQECGKAFTQVTNLNNHIRLHTGEKPFACTEPGCDKAFAQVTNLNNHRKSHQRDQRAFSCELCGQAFVQRGQLARHVAMDHAGWAGALYGGGPIQACQACGEAFSRPEDLAHHVSSECRESGDGVAAELVRRAPAVAIRRRKPNKVLPEDEIKKKAANPVGGNHIKCLFGDCKQMFSSVPGLHNHLIVQHSLTVNAKSKSTKTIDHSDEIIEIEDDDASSEPVSTFQSQYMDYNNKAKAQPENTAHHMKQERPDSSSDSDSSDTSEEDDEDSDSQESDRRKSSTVPVHNSIQKDVKLVCNLCFATFESLQSLENHVEVKH